jgi:multiple sugar transport system ATP-binding protein
MAEVVLKQIRKQFDQTVVLKEIDLAVRDREFLVLVGPSGCGKSTILRSIAGLETVTSGDIVIDGRRVNDVAPKDRDIAMVFQNYALYPHMSVYDNMAFGLKMRKVSKKEIDAKVRKAAKVLELENLLTRKPKQLSGGQRQRVALGRAMVRDPKVFLMDEPLSNLDAKLRQQMRTEITRLHRELGATTIYVTHDQTEALTMGDRIVVLHQGVLQQVDTPINVYAKPANLFVAGFIGQMNVLPAVLDLRSVTVPGLHNAQWRLPDSFQPPEVRHQKVLLGLRPEHFRLATADDAAGAILSLTPERVELLGSEKLVYFPMEGQSAPLIVKLPPDAQVSAQTPVTLFVDLAKASLFDPETSQRL